ncbi:hypothetical protein GCM10010156_48890 [Planobispora rosea]|uniref:Histidine kinase/HSP90-like ATPase domain-containing protein n=1 Tax=Planobispora rosea TaxID=35762 RepID=A0A8J3S3Z8_PLARO|nr:ATP-binding protein [Planobispora rosea]GGS84497.1 hypothetical protein GCM10010156_48890 [Planobispora rosea]GIH86400.1 hypothetical protein Pro02_48080 [Planobispora rosea]
MTTPTMAAVSAQRRFPGESEQVSQVRTWVDGLLPGDCPRRADVAVVVSELVTNALVHSVSGMGGSFAVRAAIDATSVELSVADQGPRPIPAAREPDASGWGLAVIVAELVDEIRTTITPAGRTTWCRLTWPNGRS